MNFAASEAIDIVTVENYKEMYDSMATGNFDMAMGTLFVNAAMDSITPFSNTLYHSDVILVTSDLQEIETVNVEEDWHNVPTGSRVR